MDFDQAIAAHSGWKPKLTTYLKNPDKSLKHLDTAQANKCDLGQWLDGEGKKFADRPEFAKLKTDHMRFHKVAADIVRRVNLGEAVSEDEISNAKGEFVAASGDVVRALVAMKSKV